MSYDNADGNAVVVVVDDDADDNADGDALVVDDDDDI